MEKHDFQDVYVKKEDVIAELLKPRMVGSVSEYAQQVFKGINRLSTYTATEKESVDYIDLYRCGVVMIHQGTNKSPVKKPQGIRFRNVNVPNGQHSDVRPFKSSSDYVMQVCLKIIEVYGEECFKRAVFAEVPPLYFNENVPYFVKSKKFMPNKAWLPVLDDCYVIGDLSWEATIDFVKKLVQMFPEAKHELIYG